MGCVLFLGRQLLTARFRNHTHEYAYEKMWLGTLLQCTFIHEQFWYCTILWLFRENYGVPLYSNFSAFRGNSVVENKKQIRKAKTCMAVPACNSSYPWGWGKRITCSNATWAPYWDCLKIKIKIKNKKELGCRGLGSGPSIAKAQILYIPEKFQQLFWDPFSL